MVTAVAFFLARSLSGDFQIRNTAQEVSKFVQGFYDWYVPRALKSDVELQTLKEKAPMFTPELRNALIEDRKAQEKVSNEIVGLDFDPFLNSQDLADTYTVKKIEHKGKTWLASVYGHYKGTKEDSAPSVMAQVEKTKTGWRFTNFLYEKDNLLGVLKQLKKDRTKH